MYHYNDPNMEMIAKDILIIFQFYIVALGHLDILSISVLSNVRMEENVVNGIALNT